MHTLLKTSDTVGKIVNFKTKWLDRDIIDAWQMLNRQLRHSLPQLDRCERIQCSIIVLLKHIQIVLSALKSISNVDNSDRTCKIPVIDIVSYQTIDHFCI